MAPAPNPRQRHDPVAVLCKLAGAPDLETYLGIPPGATTKDALVRLERKRRALEQALHDPAQAREAELFLEAYDQVRERLGRTADVGLRPDPEAPDYYQALGVQPEASYAEVEKAWRRLQGAGRDAEPLVAQAWRVLGDPLNRAHYDRVRREAAPADPPSDVGDELDVDPRASVELIGASSREVVLDGDEEAVVTVPFVVRGGRWRASVGSDHPAVTTTPAHRVDVGPGRHTLVVRVSPERLRGRATTATVTLANPSEQHVIVVRARRAGPVRRFEPLIVAGVAVLLVAVGWVLGAGTTVFATAVSPGSVGDLDQVPTAAACFRTAREPLPRHVDVHIDGFGRPTGFSFGGPADPEAEACVRESLVSLKFPPTPDGLPTFHRYQLGAPASLAPDAPTPTPGSP